MSIQIASDPVLFCAFPLKEQDRRSQSTMHVLGWHALQAYIDRYIPYTVYKLIYDNIYVSLDICFISQYIVLVL